MGDQRPSWQEVFDALFSEAAVAELAEKIGSQLPAAEFRRAISNIAGFAFATAALNPRPWREQERGLKAVAARARKAAAALRELHKSLEDARWVHNRQQLLDAIGWTTSDDLIALADHLGNLTLPAKAMADARENSSA
jgi:hypothetical protein